MKPTRVLLVAAALLPWSAPARAQALDSAGRAQVVRFVTGLQDAVRRGDRAAVAGMAAYPFQVTSLGRRARTVGDSAQFVRAYGVLFGNEVRGAVLGLRPDSLYGTWSDVMVGSSFVWLDVGCARAADPGADAADAAEGGGCLRLRGLNVVEVLHGPDEVERQRGFWLGWGVGGGSVRFTCDSCVAALNQPKYTGRYLGGWELSMSLGWAPSAHLLFGMEMAGWMHGLSGDTCPTLGAYSFTASWYPRVKGGPLLEAGIGWAQNGSATGTGDPIEPISKTASPPTDGWGRGYKLGFGWDIRGVTPRVAWAFGTSPTLESPNGGIVAHGWHYNAVLLEAGFRMHL